MVKPGLKRNAISLEVKMELLKTVDLRNSSRTDISKKFGIGRSTLSEIIKNREQITAMFERSSFEPDRKRMRRAKHKDLETALLIWFKQAKSLNSSISGPLLLEKADAFALQMGIEFTANPGWLERFKKRNGIVFKNNEENQEPKSWQDTLRTVLEEYKAKDIFNADETGLFYSCLPDETLNGQCFTDEYKERITVMLACNSNGSEKLPVFVIGNMNVNYFKNVKLPVEYTANEKAWMTVNTFTDWLLRLDKRFLRENRKVAIIVDHCPAHSEVKLKAIKLIFMQPNILQPSEQGIIQNFKFYYRKELLSKYLATIESNEDFSVNLLDALHMINTAWNLVTPKTIENCFRQVGVSKITDIISQDDQENEPILSDMFEHVSSLLESSISLDEFIAVDNDLCTAPILTDSDILDVVRSMDVDLLEEVNDNVDDDSSVSNVPAEMGQLIKDKTISGPSDHLTLKTMFLKDICCICLRAEEYLTHLLDTNCVDETYYSKLISSIPEMEISKLDEHGMICGDCCKELETVYMFRVKCLNSKQRLIHQISQLGNSSNTAHASSESSNNKKNHLIPKKESKESDSSFQEMETIFIPIKKEVEDVEEVETFGETVDSTDAYIASSSNYGSIIETDAMGRLQDSRTVIKKENDISEQTVGNKISELKHSPEKNKDLSSGKKKYSYEKCGGIINRHKCEICQKTFLYKCRLNIHLRKHTQEKPFTCDLCEKTFTMNAHLIVHKRQHTGEKPFKCDECDKAFTLNSSLLAHTRAHEGVKLFTCHQCGKQFTRNASLLIHMKIHKGVKSFKCDLCDKAFTQNGNLMVHKRSHSGEKPYKCEQCQKSFSTSSEVVRHKKTHIHKKETK